jgi:hypothetical protein
VPRQQVSPADSGMRMLNGRLLHFDIGGFLLSSDLMSVHYAHKDCNTPTYLLAPDPVTARTELRIRRANLQDAAPLSGLRCAVAGVGSDVLKSAIYAPTCVLAARPRLRAPGSGLATLHIRGYAAH